MKMKNIDYKKDLFVCFDESETSNYSMQRTITFFNMGFGNSFLIKDGKDSLLVDCGSNKYNDVADEIENIINSILDDSNLKDLKTTIGELFAIFREINSILSEEGRISYEMLEEIVSNQDESKKEINEEDIEKFVKNFVISRPIQKKLSDLENGLSIVFEIDSKLLMCGDANNHAMKCAIKKHMENNNIEKEEFVKFDIIKVPHHGTKDYFYQFNGANAIF